jgi:SAM-dependent methyltransferase
MAGALAPAIPATHFEVADVDHQPWPDASVDAVICSAVLHFADDANHFGRMVHELWRVLAPNGLLVARLASNIGLEALLGAGGRRVRLPDGSDRFIVDEPMLMDWTARLNARLADPLKTTVVQGLRSMTTWCVIKE